MSKYLLIPDGYSCSPAAAALLYQVKPFKKSPVQLAFKKASVKNGASGQDLIIRDHLSTSLTSQVTVRIGGTNRFFWPYPRILKSEESIHLWLNLSSYSASVNSKNYGLSVPSIDTLKEPDEPSALG